MRAGSSSRRKSGRADVAERAPRVDRAQAHEPGAAGRGCLIFVLGAIAWLAAMLLLVLAGSRTITVGPTASPSPAVDSSLVYADAGAAPPLELIDSAARPFALTSLRGHDVLVFFGYTHCPDVCPATIGIIGQALAAVGPQARAVFVTIDPERDTPTWLSDYVRFLPAGFVALTGSAGEIRTTADAWGVRYARVETGSAAGYAMSHTADVFLVDTVGRLRARLPFGTDAATMIGLLRSVAASTQGVTPAPTAVTVSGSPTPAPTMTAGQETLRPEVVSTSVWAGGASPVILALFADAGRLDDPSLHASVQLRAADGSAVGAPADATPIRPPGVERVSYVVTLNIPSAGSWTLEVTAISGGITRSGTVALTALDPGATAALGAPAPTVHTPTVADVGGDLRAVTTDPAPDLRLSQHSTSDVLAAHVPFVLVIDSSRFRVSSVCGKAILLARYLADRWPDVAFIHLEPFVYTLVSETPVLSGDIADPPLSPVAAAWGIGGAPWGARSVPWLFVVDGTGTVRAKYQGIIGSDDVDILLAFVTRNR